MKKNEMIEALIAKGFNIDDLDKLTKADLESLYSTHCVNDLSKNSESLIDAEMRIGDIIEASQAEVLTSKEELEAIKSESFVISGQPMQELEKSRIMTTASMNKKISEVNIQDVLKNQDKKFHGEVYVDDYGNIIPREFIKINPVDSNYVDMVALDNVGPFKWGKKTLYFQKGLCYSVPREVKANLKLANKVL